MKHLKIKLSTLCCGDRLVDASGTLWTVLFSVIRNGEQRYRLYTFDSDRLCGNEIFIDQSELTANFKLLQGGGERALVN